MLICCCAEARAQRFGRSCCSAQEAPEGGTQYEVLASHMFFDAGENEKSRETFSLEEARTTIDAPSFAFAVVGETIVSRYMNSVVIKS